MISENKEYKKQQKELYRQHNAGKISVEELKLKEEELITKFQFEEKGEYSVLSDDELGSKLNNLEVELAEMELKNKEHRDYLNGDGKLERNTMPNNFRLKQREFEESFSTTANLKEMQGKLSAERALRHMGKMKQEHQAKQEAFKAVQAQARANAENIGNQQSGASE